MKQDMGKTQKGNSDSADRVASDSYDPHIVPAETAARMEREGDLFKTAPTEKGQASAKTDEQTESNSVRTTDGYTVDQEGLLNNYAIEPEMYINEPGDLRESEESNPSKSSQDYQNLNHDRQGELTLDQDKRPKGPGLV
uniref:Uncharacterized protein n=1 Tax=Cyanothece sp. (strain PCC 7425 / ATCC 29141) TaxID=395961 RepID=B8HKH5_CYAP4